MQPPRRAVPAFGAAFTPRFLTRAACSSASPARAAPRMSATPTVVLAPGQGAQAPAMLEAWAAASPAAAALAAAADEQLGTRLAGGARLAALLSDAPAEKLARTDVAQPAIFVTSMAAWAGMREMGLVGGDDLAAAAGLSLGEYTALAVAGALSFEDALELVTLRGAAMQDAAEASEGGMVALIGASEEAAAQVVDACQISGSVLVAANFNAPGQVVLSGSLDCVDKAAEFAASELKLRVAKLDVAGAFHSPLMQPAADRLRAALADVHVSAPAVPVWANVTAKPHAASPDDIRAALVSQLTSPVRWFDCISAIKEDPAFAGASFVELAPGKSLTGMMRKIDRKLKVTNYAAPPAPVSG